MYRPFTIVAIAVAAFALAGCTGTTSLPIAGSNHASGPATVTVTATAPPSAPTPNAYLPERAAYAKMVAAAEGVKIDPEFVVVNLDGQVWLTYGTGCMANCAVVQNNGKNRTVLLPVTYFWSANVVPTPGKDNLQSVTTLVYWDSQLHKQVTATAKAGKLAFPAHLRHLTISQMKPGDSGYTSPDYIRSTPKGFVVIGSAIYATEPSDSSTPNSSLTTAISRVSAKLFKTCATISSSIKNKTVNGGIPIVSKCS